MFNKDKMLYQLGKVPYATVYNFQPWTAVNKQADLKSSLHYPDNLLKELRRTKIVNQVPVYPAGEEKRHARHNTFYTLKSLSSEHVSQSQTYNGFNSFGYAPPPKRPYGHSIGFY